MTAVLKNFVGGEWVDGVGVCRSINPSNTNDIVGEYTPRWVRSWPEFSSANRRF